MVILIVKTDTACPDSVIKSVTVNQMSKTCQFVASPDYTFGFYGMKFYSVDGTGNATTEAGTDYTWTINGSNYTGPLVQVNLPGDGSYDVSYCAITNSNPKCTCCTTQKVVMDRAKTNLAEGPLLHIFPNPNTGMFRISGIESYANAIPWELRSMNGSLVLSGAVHNESETTIFTGSVAPGIYLMNIDYMGKHQVTRIEIR